MQNFKRFLVYLLFTLLTHEDGVEGDEFSSGADYLQSAIRDIVIKKSERNILGLIDNQPRIATAPHARRVTSSSSLLFNGNRRFSGGEQQHHPPQPHPDSYHPDYLTSPDHHDYLSPPDNSPHSSSLPQASPSGHGGIPSPPSLTKGELASLYEAAVSAGHSVHMTGHQDSLPLQAALHEIRDTTVQHHQVGPQDATDGYYYYYYPLKSFLDGVHAGMPKPQVHQAPKDHYKTPVLTSYNTHLHNVKVEPIQTITEAPNRGKALEPLFMAISSFIGMAVMFVFTMVLWPRFNRGIKGASKEGKNNNKNNKKKPRLFQDVNWPTIIRSLVDAYACKNCRDFGRLAPYRSILSRTGRARSKK